MTEHFNYLQWLRDLPEWLRQNQEKDGTLVFSKKGADQIIEIMESAVEHLVNVPDLSMKVFWWNGRRCIGINGRYLEIDEKNEIVDGAIGGFIAERDSLLDKYKGRTKKEEARLAKLNQLMDEIPTAFHPEDRKAMEIIRKAADKLNKEKVA